MRSNAEAYRGPPFDNAGLAPVPPMAPGQTKEEDLGPAALKVSQTWLSLENALTELKLADVLPGCI